MRPFVNKSIRPFNNNQIVIGFEFISAWILCLLKFYFSSYFKIFSDCYFEIWWKIFWKLLLTENLKFISSFIKISSRVFDFWIFLLFLKKFTFVVTAKESWNQNYFTEHFLFSFSFSLQLCVARGNFLWNMYSLLYSN